MKNQDAVGGKRVVCFTGGGTGGHVFPGLAVAGELARLMGERSKAAEAGATGGTASPAGGTTNTAGGTAGTITPDLEIWWLGETRGMEADIVDRAAASGSFPGLRFHGIPAGKLRRYLSLRTIVDGFRVIFAFFASLSFLRKTRPLFLFSKGGYVSVPPVWAAAALGIPVYSHESDFDPGLATRLNLKKSKKVFVAYKESLGFLPAAIRERAEAIGNPMRREVLSGDPAQLPLYFAGLTAGGPLLLVLGGSLGARQLNELVNELIGADGGYTCGNAASGGGDAGGDATTDASSGDAANASGEADGAAASGGATDAVSGGATTGARLPANVVVVHQHGADWRAAPEQPGRYYPRAFLGPELPHLLAAAKLAVARAGAGTIWELAAHRVPMILVPLVEGSRGDQVRNARHFEGLGAAVCAVDPDAATLAGEIRAILDDDRRAVAMAAACERFPADAAARIAATLLQEIDA